MTEIPEDPPQGATLPAPETIPENVPPEVPVEEIPVEEVPVDPNAYDPAKDPEMIFISTLPAAENPPVPLVKQCQEQGHNMFGAVAVDGGPNKWGVMHPQHGGHWATNEEVWTWVVLDNHAEQPPQVTV